MTGTYLQEIVLHCPYMQYSASLGLHTARQSGLLVGMQAYCCRPAGTHLTTARLPPQDRGAQIRQCDRLGVKAKHKNTLLPRVLQRTESEGKKKTNNIILGKEKEILYLLIFKCTWPQECILYTKLPFSLRRRHGQPTLLEARAGQSGKAQGRKRAQGHF